MLIYVRIKNIRRPIITINLFKNYLLKIVLENLKNDKWLTLIILHNKTLKNKLLKLYNEIYFNGDRISIDMDCNSAFKYLL